MNEEFRNRAFLPVVIPLGIVLTILAVVALFALILLYNSRITALVLATLMAGGILLSVSLAASRDRLDTRGRAAVLAAGGAPVLIGALIALGVVGIPEDQLNINRQPHTVIPEDAPVIAAESTEGFCDPVDGCDLVDRMTLPADRELTLVFENRDEGVPHDWTMVPSEDEATGDPPEDAVIASTSTESGFAELTATIPATEAGEYFFYCTVHPTTMTGTLVVSEDAEEAVIGSDGG